MKMRMLIASLSVLMGLTVPAPRAWTQAVGGAEGARPVTGDPGMSWMLVADEPEFRVLRDYAEPGATRRDHSHDATTHTTRRITCSCS